MRKSLIIFFSLFVTAVMAKPEMSDTTININDVVVTGTRTPRTLATTPVVTRVISEEEFKKLDVTNVADLLVSEIPGLEFSYSMGQQVSLNFQGFTGTRVLFLIDGEKMAGETLDNVDYSRLNLDNVERIEIVRGAASSLYGSNAVGGVINIITKKQKQPWSLNLMTKVGVHSLWENSLAWGLKKGKWTNDLNIHHNRVSSYDLPAGDVTTVFGNHSWNFKDKMTYQVNDRLLLTGRYGYFFRQRDYAELQKDRYRDFDGALKMNYNISDATDLEVSYHFDQYDKSDYYPNKDKDYRDYSNVQNTLRGLLNHSFNKDMTLTVGGDALADYLLSYQFKDNGSHTQYSGDIFSQFEWNICRQLDVLGGVRVDWFSEIGAHVSPRLQLKYRPIDRLSLRAGYSNGFRAPTLKERFMTFDMASIFTIYGNEDLKSENSHNLNLSMEYLHHRYSFTVSGYYNIVSNKIGVVWDTDKNGMLYVNSDKVNISGLDATFQYRTTFGLGTKLSYAYTHESSGKSETYVPAARPHSFTAIIDYGKSWKNYSFNIALNGKCLSGMTTKVLDSSYQKYEDVTYSGYTLWKLVLTQTIYDCVHIGLTLDNIFNYKPSYYHFNSPFTTGTNVMASFSLDIDNFVKKL